MGGYFGAPKTPKNGKIGGFGGPETPPQNIFWVIFYHLLILFGLSAFQDCFTFYFTMILRDFMIIFKIFRFFGKNLGILHSKICPKIRKMCALEEALPIDLEK